jgi:hypothetical protein
MLPEKSLLYFPDKKVVFKEGYTPMPACTYGTLLTRVQQMGIWVNISVVAFPVFSQIQCQFPWR